eukprot:COSAG01_NODE_14279_length_1473_cov_2.910480_3_plen_148_part_00
MWQHPLWMVMVAPWWLVVGLLGTTDATLCSSGDRASVGYSMFKGSTVAVMANVSGQEGCCALCHGKHSGECTGWEYVQEPAWLALVSRLVAQTTAAWRQLHAALRALVADATAELPALSLLSCCRCCGECLKWRAGLGRPQVAVLTA